MLFSNFFKCGLFLAISLFNHIHTESINTDLEVISSTKNNETDSRVLYNKRHNKEILFLNYNWIIFKDKIVKCQMYKESCNFHVLIKKPIDVNELTLKSEDESIFKFVSIEQCSNTNISTSQNSCGAIIEYFKNETTQVNLDKFKIYTVVYSPVLVGFSALEFALKSTELISFDIIITQPRRIIDYVFDVWIYCFGVIISTIMGILIDKKCLFEIFKIPVPVIIGKI